MLTDAPIAAKRTAIKIKSGKYTNPMRRSVFSRSALLTRWYTEIPYEMALAMTETGAAAS